MTRLARVYPGNDAVPVYDYTDLLIWEDCDIIQVADQGQSGTGTIRIVDVDSDTPNVQTGKYLAAHNVLLLEDGPYRLGRVRIESSEYSRGERRGQYVRFIDSTVSDYNHDLTGIVVNNWNRPAETDYARVQALIAAYLKGSPRATTSLNSSNYVSSSNTVTVPAKLYNGVQPAEILQELATTADKLIFVDVDGNLHYEGKDSVAFLSGLRISDDPADASAVTYGPIFDAGAPSDLDGTELLSHLRAYYNTPTGGQASVQVSNTNAPLYDYWEGLWWDDKAKTASEAATRANQKLAETKLTHVVHSLTIGPIPWSQLGELKAGMVIQIKSKWLLGGKDGAGAYVYQGFQNRRIAELRWKCPAPDTYFATLRLDRNPKLLSAVGGSKGAVSSATATPGTDYGAALLLPRLYPSGVNIGTPTPDASWNRLGGVSFAGQLDTTQNTGLSTGTNTTDVAVNENTLLKQYKYVLTGTVVFDGGSVRGQGFGKMRSGLGIGANIGQSQMVVRLMTSAHAVKATLLSAHNAAGLDSTQWSNEGDGGPSPPSRNQMFPADSRWSGANGAPLASATGVSGDYILIEIGVRYFSIGGAGGVNCQYDNDHATDLAAGDQTSTTELNSWFEFMSASAGVIATPPPPAATTSAGSIGTTLGLASLSDHSHPVQTAGVTPITDADGLIDGSTVEAALEQLASPPTVIKSLLNRTGGAVIRGDLVKIDTSSTAGFVANTTTNFNDSQLMIVVDDVILNDDTGRVLLSGYAPRVNIGSNAGSVGHRLYGSNMALRAYGSNTRTAGAFGIVLGSNADPPAIIWSTTDPTDIASAGGGGTGAPTTSLYVVGQGDSGLSAEIIVPRMRVHRDRVPSSPNAADDEFDTVAAGTPTGWTNLGTPDSVDASTTLDSHLYLSAAAAAAYSLKGVYKAWSPSNGDTVTIRVSDSNSVANFNMGGVFLAAATPVRCIAAVFTHDSTPGKVASKNWSTLAGGALTNNVIVADSPVPVYLRLRYNSSTSVDVLYSRGGRIWRLITGAINPGFTVGAVGILVNAENASNPSQILVDWIRFNL